jgi:Fur family ferric uptake transcriptional regulator
MNKSRAADAVPAADWLREHGLRATQGRIAIVRLLDASRVPLTLADIHEKVRNKGCDFTTVFRFVSILEEKALVQRVAWIDGSTRHEMSARPNHDGHAHHHHYLICRACHKVEPLDECVVERFEDQIAESLAAAFRRVSGLPETRAQAAARGKSKALVSAANWEIVKAMRAGGTAKGRRWRATRAGTGFLPPELR